MLISREGFLVRLDLWDPVGGTYYSYKDSSREKTSRYNQKAASQTHSAFLVILEKGQILFSYLTLFLK